jgi:RNA polymerase sigma factor (sigma-70 family)
MRQLFRRYHLPLEDAEDIVQQSLLILVYNAAGVRNPIGYFLGTVRREVSHLLRRRAAERLVQLADEHPEQLVVESPAALIERRHDAQRLLKQLPPLVRQIAILHLGAGFQHREIAKALGLNEASVRQILSRGLKRLHSELALSAAAHATVPPCPDPAPPATTPAPAHP